MVLQVGSLSNSQLNKLNKNINHVEDETSYEINFKSLKKISFGTSIVFEADYLTKYDEHPKLTQIRLVFFNEISIYQPQNIDEVMERRY